MTKNTLKSIGAVLAGVILGIVLSLGTDVILETTGIFPSFAEQQRSGLFVPWMLLLAALYRTVYTFFGGYLTAALSPRTRRDTVILGILAFIANFLGIFAALNSDLGPVWYPILLTILAYPAVWLGARLKTNHQ